MERQRLKDKKREVELLIKKLRDQYELMTQKDYDEKLAFLQKRFNELDNDLMENPDTLALSQLLK